MWKLFLVLFLSILPTLVLAKGMVPCGGPGEESCQTCHVVGLVSSVMGWVVMICGIVAAILIVIAGFRLVVSVGDASAKAQAKSIISNMIIGYVIVLASWLMIDFMLKALLLGSSYSVWNTIQCTAQPVPIASVGHLTATGNNAVVLSPAVISSHVHTINNSPLNQNIVDAAVAAGLTDPNKVKTFLALISQLSNNCTDKVGPETGDGIPYGCGQILVSTAKTLDPTLSGLTDEEIAQKLKDDDEYNLALSAKYYVKLLDMYGDSNKLAIAAYNGGTIANMSSQNCPGLKAWQCPWDSSGCYNTQDTSCTVNKGYSPTRNLVANVTAIAFDHNLEEPDIPLPVMNGSNLGGSPEFEFKCNNPTVPFGTTVYPVPNPDSWTDLDKRFDMNTNLSVDRMLYYGRTDAYEITNDKGYYKGKFYAFYTTGQFDMSISACPGDFNGPPECVTLSKMSAGLFWSQDGSPYVQQLSSLNIEYPACNVGTGTGKWYLNIRPSAGDASYQMNSTILETSKP